MRKACKNKRDVAIGGRFLGIMCHVGIDVGTNTTAPKILMERLGMTIDEAAFATSLYFIFRTGGCLLGSYLLSRMSTRLFFTISVFAMLFAMIGLFVFNASFAYMFALRSSDLAILMFFLLSLHKRSTTCPKRKTKFQGL
jgi:fucose permease